MPQGGGCAVSAQCSTGFCVDGVCCNTAWTDPRELCNRADQVGTCVNETAPAPTMSRGALALLALVLGAMAVVTLRRRARKR